LSLTNLTSTDETPEFLLSSINENKNTVTWVLEASSNITSHIKSNIKKIYRIMIREILQGLFKIEHYYGSDK
jgi:hypothetical protein